MGLTRYEAGSGHIQVTMPPLPQAPVMELPQVDPGMVLALNRLAWAAMGAVGSIGAVLGFVVGRLW